MGPNPGHFYWGLTFALKSLDADGAHFYTGRPFGRIPLAETLP